MIETDETIFKKELLTQKEVADYFRVRQGTIINWRKRGLLSCWQAPGSSRVLYLRDDVKEFFENNLISRKESAKPKAEKIKVKPCVSSPKKEWRI